MTLSMDKRNEYTTGYVQVGISLENWSLSMHPTSIHTGALEDQEVICLWKESSEIVKQLLHLMSEIPLNQLHGCYSIHMGKLAIHTHLKSTDERD